MKPPAKRRAMALVAAAGVLALLLLLVMIREPSAADVFGCAGTRRARRPPSVLPTGADLLGTGSLLSKRGYPSGGDCRRYLPGGFAGVSGRWIRRSASRAASARSITRQSS